MGNRPSPPWPIKCVASCKRPEPANVRGNAFKHLVAIGLGLEEQADLVGHVDKVIDLHRSRRDRGRHLPTAPTALA